jgi:hypothetical protein
MEGGGGGNQKETEMIIIKYYTLVFCIKKNSQYIYKYIQLIWNTDHMIYKTSLHLSDTKYPLLLLMDYLQMSPHLSLSK